MTSGDKDDGDNRNEAYEEERNAEAAEVVPHSVGESALDSLVERWSAFGKELRQSNNRYSIIYGIPHIVFLR